MGQSLQRIPSAAKWVADRLLTACLEYAGENEGKLWDVAEEGGSAAPAVESLTSATFFSKKRWNSSAEIRLSAGVRPRPSTLSMVCHILRGAECWLLIV